MNMDMQVSAKWTLISSLLCGIVGLCAGIRGRPPTQSSHTVSQTTSSSSMKQQTQTTSSTDTTTSALLNTASTHQATSTTVSQAGPVVTTQWMTAPVVLTLANGKSVVRNKVTKTVTSRGPTRVSQSLKQHSSATVSSSAASKAVAVQSASSLTEASTHSEARVESQTASEAYAQPNWSLGLQIGSNGQFGPIASCVTTGAACGGLLQGTIGYRLFGPVWIDATVGKQFVGAGFRAEW